MTILPRCSQNNPVQSGVRAWHDTVGANGHSTGVSLFLCIYFMRVHWCGAAKLDARTQTQRTRERQRKAGPTRVVRRLKKLRLLPGLCTAPPLVRWNKRGPTLPLAPSAFLLSGLTSTPFPFFLHYIQHFTQACSAF